MKIDLIQDMNEIVAKQWLERNDIPMPQDKNNLLEFLRWYRLQIPQIPRRVFISKELKHSENFKKYEKEIIYLENKFKNGEDVMPFTSKRKKPTFYNGNPNDDYLLNDWNIHHFHLNTQLDKDNKIQRSKYLLFCFIDERNVYFLNIYPHTNNWTNKNLLEIMDNNWGNVLEQYRMEIKPILNPNNDEIKEFRKFQIISSVTIGNGKSFLTPGGGYTLDGTSTQVLFWRISIDKQLSGIEAMFKERKININETINSVQLFDCLSFETDKSKIRLTNLWFLINGKRGLNVQNYDGYFTYFS